MAEPQNNSNIYLISPSDIPDISEFSQQLSAALETGHVSTFQLRMKEADKELFTRYSKQLLPLCHRYNVPLIINDYADIAHNIGADGLHIGEGAEYQFEEARKILGSDKAIGVSCYGSTDRALEFAEKGAEYVSFGAFYPTTTKTPKARPEPEILQWWVNNCTVPCVAIGGISPDNLSPLVNAGADFIAVVSYVWGHPKGTAEAMIALAKAINAETV